MKFSDKVMVLGCRGFVYWTPSHRAQALVETGAAMAEKPKKKGSVRIIQLLNSISNDSKNDRQSTTSLRLHTHSRAEGFGLKQIAHELEACGLVGVRV